MTDRVQELRRAFITPEIVTLAEEQARDSDGKFASTGGGSDAPAEQSVLTEKELKDGQKVAREYSKATNIYDKVEGTHEEKMAAIHAAGKAVWEKHGLPDNNYLRSTPTAENIARALKGEDVQKPAYVPVTKEQGQRMRQERAAARIERGIKGGVVNPNLKASAALVFAEDQPRDDQGRFSSEGGGGDGGESKAPLTVADVKAKAIPPDEMNDYTRTYHSDHKGKEMQLAEVKSKDGERLGRVYQIEESYQKFASPRDVISIGTGYTKGWKADTGANDRMLLGRYPGKHSGQGMEVTTKYGGGNFRTKADAISALVEHHNNAQGMTAAMTDDKQELARSRRATGQFVPETPDNQLEHGAREGAKVVRTREAELRQTVAELVFPPESIMGFEQERDEQGRFASGGGGGESSGGETNYEANQGQHSPVGTPEERAALADTASQAIQEALDTGKVGEDSAENDAVTQALIDLDGAWGNDPGENGSFTDRWAQGDEPEEIQQDLDNLSGESENRGVDYLNEASYDGPNPQDFAQNLDQHLEDQFDEDDTSAAQDIVDGAAGAAGALESYVDSGGGFLDDRATDFDDRITHDAFPEDPSQEQLDAAMDLASELNSIVEHWQGEIDNFTPEAIEQRAFEEAAEERGYSGPKTGYGGPLGN